MRLRFSLTGYSVFLSTVVSTLTISGEVADHSVVKDIANIVSAFDLLESPNCTAAYWNKTLIVDKACTNLNNSISDGENKIALFSVRPPITQCSGQLIDIYWCNVSLSFDIKCIEKEASSWEPDAHNLATIEEDREYKRHHHHSGHHHHHHNGHHHHHHHHGGHFHLHGHHHGHFHPHRHVHVGFGYFPVWTHLFYGHPYYWGSATALVTICLVILCIICIRTACLSPHLDECHSCECVEPAPLVVMQGPPPQQIPSAEQQLHP